VDRIASSASVTAIGVEVSGSDHMVVLALSRSNAPFRLHVDVGSRFPALISATGRLVAAFSDFSDKELERRFKALRWDQAPEFAAWKADVDAVRRQGYSVDRNNYINGVVVIAVPVLDSHTRMTHALVAAGLAEQLDAARVESLAHELQAEAHALSQLLAAGN